MATSSSFFLWRWIAALWRALDFTRRAIINLLLLAIILMIVIGLLRRGPPALGDNTTLVLALQGPIVDQRAGNVRDSAVAQLRGDATASTTLRDVLAVLDAAVKDPKISRVVLQLDELGASGQVNLHEVAQAIDRFKAAGKKVIAWGSSYDQRQYYLAAHADQVLLHPYGGLMVEGFGHYRNYYKDALDKLGVTVNLVRVGTYKSAGEPYIANGPSPAAKEAEAYYNNGLWATYTADVEAARKLPAGSVMKLIDELPERLRAAGGDPARLALASKLVDALKTRDEARQLLMELGAKSDDGKSFRQIGFGDYLARLTPKRIGDAVGVVIAEGEIVEGQASPGTIGGLSTAELIRQAREDDSIKAVVLRVNSPGGSVFASELIRREMELTQKAGKPVVVSMGNVAASGGYWIAQASDEVIADPSTITGSIGVFALMPTADKALEKLGVHAAGTTTTWLGGAGDPRLPTNPRFLGVVQQGVDHIYDNFTSVVAKARKTTQPKIDAVAQGRVWTGAQAKDRGLIDRLGSYGDALASAAARAKLAADYRVVYIEREPTRFERVLSAVSGDVAQTMSQALGIRLAPAAIPAKAAREMDRELGRLAALADSDKPYTALIHCLCGAP